MAGYSGTPLAKKLGLKTGFNARVVNPPEGYFDWLEPQPDGIDWVTTWQADLDFVHIFSKQRSEHESTLKTAMERIQRNGMIWLSWPKKASKVPTDMTENVVREIALPLGLVDVKVCAVNEIWSGLKLVIRKELR